MHVGQGMPNKVSYRPPDMIDHRTLDDMIWVFEWRKSVHYWWSYILFSPEYKELTSMLDPLLCRWSVPPVVIRCVHWTMQREVLQTWITTQSPAIVIGFNHGVLGLAENPARGTGFWSQNTEGVARGFSAKPSTPWLKPIIACPFIVIQPLLSSNYQ